MDNIFTFIIISFGIIGFALIIFAYYPMIKMHIYKKQKKKQDQSNSLINESLNIIRVEKNEEKVAKAFICLMMNSYVLVHIIVNKGNNYKDDIQCKAFCDFLTPDVVTRIKSLEDKDGTCTF